MPETSTIGGTLERFAKTRTDEPAILAPDHEALRYGPLWRQVETIGSALTGLDLTAGDRIATVFPNGPEAAVSFVGVASWTAVAPLNSGYTQSEFDYYLRDLGAKALMVHADIGPACRAAAAAIGIPILEIMSAPDQVAGTIVIAADGQVGAPSMPLASSADVALLLHTSGTTARPKIVPLRHANLCASAANMRDWMRLGETDQCLNVMPLFHIHGLVAGVLVPLLSGGSVNCQPGFRPNAFFSALNNGATWFSAVPTIHHAILAAADHADDIAACDLKFIRSSSAPLPASVMGALEATFGVPVIEAFSMTEAAHQMCCNPLPPGARRTGTVGLPAGVDIAIMDDAGQVLQTGAIGEVVIRGPGVTHGYDQNPDANAKAFTDGWFRTGDQGRLDDHGYLTLTGRLKEIINRGGESIAPLEIDYVLLDHTDVIEALAYPIPHPTLEEDVAAAVVLRDGAVVTEDALRNHVRARLSDAKVPRRIVILPAIPKGPTGKPQRLELAKQLADGTVDTSNDQAASQRPMTDLEAGLHALWAQTLGHPDFGPEDDFFVCGGDSLQAVHLVGEVNRVYVRDFAPELVFDRGSTVAAMAAAIEQPPVLDATQRFLLTPGTSVQRLPASYLQRSFWALNFMHRDMPSYNVVAGLRYRGPFDHDALARALSAVECRHEALRTALRYENGDLMQVIREPSPWPLTVDDAASEHDLTEMARRYAQDPIDLSDDRLIRAHLLRRDDADHCLIMVCHHIVADGWSREILAREVAVAYGDFATGAALSLDDVGLQYADYASWQRRLCEAGALSDEQAYWARILKDDAAPLRLIGAKSDADDQPWRSARKSIELPATCTRSLRVLAADRKATLFMVLLAGFKAHLADHLRIPTITVATPFAYRPTKDANSAIGYFLNMLPLSTRMPDNGSALMSIDAVKQTVLGAWRHMAAPIEWVLLHRDLGSHIGQADWARVQFQVRNYDAFQSTERGDIRIEPFGFDPGIAPIDLSVELHETATGLCCHFVYPTGSFDSASIDALSQGFMDRLSEMAGTRVD